MSFFDRATTELLEKYSVPEIYQTNPAVTNDIDLNVNAGGETEPERYIPFIGLPSEQQFPIFEETWPIMQIQEDEEPHIPFIGKPSEQTFPVWEAFPEESLEAGRPTIPPLFGEGGIVDPIIPKILDQLPGGGLSGIIGGGVPGENGGILPSLSGIKTAFYAVLAVIGVVAIAKIFRK